jgi:hypothetical protein
MAEPGAKINVKQTVRYVVYPDADAAEAESKRILRSLQSPETQSDPRTVTRAYFSWNVNGTTRRASLIVPEDEQDKLTLPDRGRQKTYGQALADEDISEDGEGDVVVSASLSEEDDQESSLEGKGK